MSRPDDIAAPVGPVWRDHMDAEGRRMQAAQHDRPRYPAEDVPAGYGNTRPAGVNLEKLHQIEIQTVAARGKAKALDEAAGHHRQDGRQHAMAAFRHSAWVPAGERYGLAEIEPFLNSRNWPERQLAAERVSVGDLRQAVYHYKLAALFTSAANDAAKESAALRELLERLKAHAFPTPTNLIPHGGARAI